MSSYLRQINIFIRKHLLLIILGLTACAFYFIVLHNLGSIVFVKNSLFSTLDSKDYWESAKWISGNGDYFNTSRPFLYPVILLFSTKAMGFLGIWYLQIVFWFISCILVYLTVNKITGKKIIAAISFILAASNVSVICYTAHALTETTIFFLFSVLSFIITYYQKYSGKHYFLLLILFVVSLLVATKPLYQIIWYLAIFIISFLILKSFFKKPLLILLLLLASAPVLIQKSIIKIKSDTFNSTQVATRNLKDYFFRKTKFFVENDSIPNARLNNIFTNLPDSIYVLQIKQIEPFSNNEIIKYLIRHPVHTSAVYWNNLHENLCSGNPYISNENNHSLKKWTENLNANLFYPLHFAMFFVWLLYLIFKIKKRKSDAYLFILVCGILLFYVLLTSGITFWAGDRLVVPAVALWSSLYPILVFLFYKKFREKK